MKDNTQQAENKSGLRRDQVAQKAYAIWQSEGCPHGRAADHWRKAEEALKTQQPVGQTTLPTGPLAAVSKAAPPASNTGKSFARASH